MSVRANGEVAQPRFGFAVGKRVGNAVVRNRVKRRLRDVVRRSGAWTYAREEVQVHVGVRSVADDQGLGLPTDQYLVDH